MIAAGGIIAFLIIVIIIIGIIGLAPFAVKRLSAKLNFRIIGGYLAMLIVLSLVCLLLPGGVLVKGADPSQEAGNPVIRPPPSTSAIYISPPKLVPPTSHTAAVT